MKTKQLLFMFLGIFMFFACEQAPELEEEIIIPPLEEPLPIEDPVITKAVFSGYAQKGPFINGSSVLISELDEELNQTGRVYSTRIISNTGAFEQKNISLISPFVELKADGYYFNEVLGKTSSGQITLYALVDVSEINSANINVLTHLTKPRIEYLVQENKMPFAEAKAQAEEEILAIFDLTLPKEANFETFDLANDAILIAIAAILQGYSPASDVMQLMAEITDDICSDGVLNDEDLGSKLASNANVLNLSKVRENLEKKFTELKIETVVSDFESQIQQFLEKTSYEVTSLVKYPEFGLAMNDTPNLLSENTTEFLIDKDYPLTVNVPEGMTFKVLVKCEKWGTFYGGYQVPFGIVLPYENWYLGAFLAQNDSGNWISKDLGEFLDNPNYATGIGRELKLVEGGKMSELIFVFTTSKGLKVTFECYENDSQKPSYVKVITIK